jgi:N-acyl-D-aspartate/D-glutamate deacylase
MRYLASLALLVGVAVSGCAEPAPEYDLVLAGGRVMDPESGLDAIRNVGIRDGRIEAVSEEPLEGARILDVSGHVVSPGFIDLHVHGQQDASFGFAVRDGVTTALELEIGVPDIDGFYAGLEGGQRLNYGAAIGHPGIRMDLLDDPGEGLVPAGIGGSGTLSAEQLDEMERRIREGLDQGAVAVGFGSAYTPGADMAELERMFAVAGERGATVHIHMRNGPAGLDSTIAAAGRVGAPLHIVHVNSSAGDDLEAFLSQIQAAQDAGQDVTTETYPYGAGMTEIQSALFDDWESWSDDQFPQHQLLPSGERATRETFGAARARGGYVIIHSRSEELTRAAVASPITMIASDGFMVDGVGHPRTSGTFSRVLGRYVRDEGLLTLPQAIRKMTLEPAQRLEAWVPALADKGRIRVGADADITVFDPATVQDRSSYVDAAIPAEGIPYVMVGGELVVDGGELTDARPGRAVRAPVR